MSRLAWVLDWLSPAVTVTRDGDRVIAAMICPVTCSFWVVERCEDRTNVEGVVGSA